MSTLNGTYDVSVTTPLGEQKMQIDIVVDGDRFSGTSSGQMGSSEVTGDVSGDTLTWQQNITVPMPLTLDCKATIDGDTITGSVDSGTFGAFPLKGKKVG